MLLNKDNKKKRGQGIVKISDLFKKYTDVLRAPQGTVISSFIEVIEDQFGYTIRKEQCVYSVATRTLRLNVSGPLKSEILLQKSRVLGLLSDKIGKKSAPVEIL